MAIMTEETKAKRMREAFGKLAGAYISEGQNGKSMAVQKAVMALDNHNETLARLYDLLTGDAS
jgi:hypothetical protein